MVQISIFLMIHRQNMLKDTVRSSVRKGIGRLAKKMRFRLTLRKCHIPISLNNVEN